LKKKKRRSPATEIFQKEEKKGRNEGDADAKVTRMKEKGGRGESNSFPCDRSKRLGNIYPKRKEDPDSGHQLGGEKRGKYIHHSPFAWKGRRIRGRMGRGILLEAAGRISQTKRPLKGEGKGPTFF